MRKKRIACLLSLILCLSLASGALAREPEATFNARGELPDGLREQVETSEGGFIHGQLNGDTIYILLDLGEGVRQVQIFDKLDGQWLLTTQSAPISPLRGEAADFDSLRSDLLHIEYDSSKTRYTFHRERDGRWALTVVQAQDHFSVFDHHIQSEIINDEYDRRFLYGNMRRFTLRDLDAAALPRSFAEAAELIDTDGFAIVHNVQGYEWLHLRAEPSHNAKSLGKYYNLAPVKVLSMEGEWARVSVAGVEGYMSKVFLAFDQSMARVESAPMHATLRESVWGTGVAMYEKPDTASAFRGMLEEVSGGWNPWSIIGMVGDDWYHVLCADGFSGYVESKYFRDGNG